MKIDFDLENYPLQIKTDSEVGSDEEVRVRFYDSQEALIGGIFLYFTSTPKYYTVKPRYNAGRGRKNFEVKNRVIARSAL